MTALLLVAVVVCLLYLFWLALQDILYLIDHRPEEWDDGREDW